ncbi:hypothetical protein SGFS_019570 [Streptomyces graminofaciens]|uniref:Uncharacterized protein n=1 Tax=Streptomyces graminofaciens TaxID=68212 RepID=A0ABM7F480_9ACTN|nr:hypothetical protein SGFS_019570 [Streptomyces graminofaciens]
MCAKSALLTALTNWVPPVPVITLAKPWVKPLPALGRAATLPPSRRAMSSRTRWGRSFHWGRTAVEWYGGLGVMTIGIPQA